MLFNRKEASAFIARLSEFLVHATSDYLPSLECLGCFVFWCTPRTRSRTANTVVGFRYWFGFTVSTSCVLFETFPRSLRNAEIPPTTRTTPPTRPSARRS